MPDVTVKRIEEMEAVYDGAFVKARASLGVTSFGMAVVELPPNFADYPEHDETKTGQEEVYTPLRGSGRLIVGDREYELQPGVFARVGVAEKRRIVPGAEGLRLLVLGAVPGKVFKPEAWSELGAAPPGSDDG